MPQFRMQDFPSLEKSPCSPASLRNKITYMLLNSCYANAKVEMVNRETGEYRIVLHGTLDKEEGKWTE
ncbi:hypothetical protein AMJ40_07035 [candidate division TA06 bacterium DG_26]|jgi:hypothetical protein|uniref:Uncharacterized protein n=1 Tax=candidate division TA06 bacterium DG_26 TaxID=1703771 RepID=A0A0S7WEV5_UNCT6|nr:MAG: hypothetical protein AMJ40_07035 [candidate division TA06 bacterium DG_26]